MCLLWNLIKCNTCQLCFISFSRRCYCGRNVLLYRSSLFLYPWKCSIYSQSKHILDHPWKKYLEQLARFFNAWIGVDFDKPHVEIFVEDEIIPEQLKGVPPAVGVDLLPYSIH